jgi:hypothetical protein
MSSGLDELLEYKKDIEKNLDVIHILFLLLINRMKKK